MKKNNYIIGLLALGIIGGSTAMLVRLKANQILGEPGVKTSPLPGSKNLLVELPRQVPGYQAEELETQDIVIEALPKDTSFGQMRYIDEDGFSVQMNVVLMGADRTSLHKPEFCLTGGGWPIDSKELLTIKMDRPVPYHLPVQRFMSTRTFEQDGRPVELRGIYVFWFVADGQLSARHWERMWDMGKEMLKTGVLQRWAYVSCFSTCRPGQEEATYKRMEKLIQATVPEFQLTPEAGQSNLIAHQ